MSKHYEMQGSLKYESEEALNTALERLVKGGWMNDDYIWMDETEEELYSQPSPTVNHATHTLAIPNRSYRNLARIESDLFTDVKTGTIIGTCTDGMFLGWVTTEQDDWEADLNTWARTRGHERPRDETDIQQLVNWQTEIVGEFHTVYGNYPRHN